MTVGLGTERGYFDRQSAVEPDIAPEVVLHVGSEGLENIPRCENFKPGVHAV